jgi:predicted ATPase
MEEIVLALFEEEILIRDPAGRAYFAPTFADRANLALVELHMPPTIHAVLAARIDRLPPPAKELLQTVSVMGKQFPFSLVGRVTEQAEDALHGLLDQLQRAEFIYQQPATADIEYTFSHALTQEVAYNSLLLERRRVLHGQTAQAIEAEFSDHLEEHYGELAHHYSLSGTVQKAIEYLQLAGEQAVQRSANAEAITHFSTALTALETTPETPDRERRELLLRLDVGVPLVITKGVGASEVGATYTRALALVQQSGDTTLLFPVLRGLWEFHEVRGALHTAQALGEQLLALAQHEHDSTRLLIAHGALADTFLWCGEFIRAREHAEQGIALYALSEHRTLAFLYGGHDLGVASLLWRALSQWFLGYPEQALLSIHQALPLLEELTHPYSTVHTLSFAAILHQLLRKPEAVQERLETVFSLSQGQEFAQYTTMQSILHGWVLGEQEQSAEGIARIAEGLASWRALGAELMRPYYLSLLAQAHAKREEWREGIRLLDEALATVQTTAEGWWEAELYRLKGEFLLKAAQ